jgi:hypothetical protein
VNQRAHLSDVGIVVKYDNAICGETHIQLHAIGAVSDGQLESLDAVVGGVGRGTTMAENERSVGLDWL